MNDHVCNIIVGLEVWVEVSKLLFVAKIEIGEKQQYKDSINTIHR